MYITDLFEAKNTPVIVTYPGRFQPFHQGHAGVFAELQKLFGKNNVYILTSNDQSGSKSPFDFSDKRQLMTAAGVPGDHIVQTTAMYALPEGFDPHNTIFVTAVGAPDADRLNPDSVLKRDKKDKAGNIIKPAGSPGYYKIWGGADQAVTADQHGYVVVIPEIHKAVKIKGKTYDVSHGTECRNLWNIIRGDAKARSEFLSQLYGRPDAKLGEIFDKIPATVSESAPPGAKAERMVKHIKKGYARDGKLTDKEKSIAFATAWKAHNAGKVEETDVNPVVDTNTDVRGKQDTLGLNVGTKVGPGNASVQPIASVSQDYDPTQVTTGVNANYGLNVGKGDVTAGVTKMTGMPNNQYNIQGSYPALGGRVSAGVSASKDQPNNINLGYTNGGFNIGYNQSQDGKNKNLIAKYTKTFEEWSQKYKKSINCSHPKGFSQKAHCAGKKKHNESIEMEMVCEDCGMCETHGDHSKNKLDELKCWPGYTRVQGVPVGAPGSCKKKTNEAGKSANPRQAAIAIAMKAAGKKPKHVNEAEDLNMYEPRIQDLVKTGKIHPSDAAWMNEYHKTPGDSRVETGKGAFKDSSEKMQNFVNRMRSGEIPVYPQFKDTYELKGTVARQAQQGGGSSGGGMGLSGGKPGQSPSLDYPPVNEAAGVGVVATNKKMARDPRYSTSMTVDVHPDTPKKQLKALRLAEMQASDFEIRNFEKLDTILTELCKQVIAHQKDDADYWGMVAACVVDPDDNVVPGINYLDDSGKRVHAERAAIDSYREHFGEIPEGSIIVTTLSPCCHPLEERYGESCTELINDTDVHKVYCGYKDPTQEQTMNRTFHIMQTRNASIVELCKSFADTFLGKINEDTDTKHSIDEDEMMVMVKEFLPVAMKDLKIKRLPHIVLQPYVEEHDGQATFGRFVDAEERIYLGIADRHPVDILRTLAHELVHFKQYEDDKMYPGAGQTGSPIENEAHVVAGIIMRHFNKKYPMAIKSKPLEL
jgi:pyrimidine deaminase RibD-like protein